MKNEERENWRAALVSFWLALAGFILIMVITGPRGIGMTTDSVVYFQAAKYAATGEGFLNYSKSGVLEPLGHYPPLYPAVLALGAYIGIDTFGWARILNAVLFAVNVSLFSLLAFYVTGRRRSALLAGWLAVLFVQIVEIHAIALSEPLFITLMLLSWGCLMVYLENFRRAWLIGAAALAGLSMLARFGGLAVVVAGAVAIMLSPSREGRRKSRELLLYLVAALVLPWAWAWRNLTVIGAVNDFHYGFFPQATGNIVRGIDTLSFFLLPSVTVQGVRWTVLLLFIAALAVLVRDVFRDAAADEGGSRLRTAWLVLGSFILVYALGTLGTALGISEGSMPLDRRILLPLPVAVIALVPTLLRKKNSEGISRRMVSVRALVLLIFLGLMFLRTAQLAKAMYNNGFGYSSKLWAESALVKTVRTLADDVPVYSNDPQAFYFYAERPAILIPQSPEDIASFPRWETLKRHFVDQRAVAVIFAENEFTPQAVWWKTARQIPLKAFMRDGWGAIYGYKRPAPPMEKATSAGQGL